MLNSKLIIGGAQIGNNYGLFSKNTKMKNKNELKEIFNFSIKNKINFIDTAYDYQNSENIIGKLSKKKFLITSKIHIPKIFSENKLKLFIYKKIQKSLARLNRKYIDIILIHNFDNYLTNYYYLKKIFKIFKNLKKDKIVKKIGISTYYPEKVHQCFNSFNFEIVQAPLNIFDQRLLESKIYKLKKFRKVKIHVRSVFLQGILLKKKYPRYFNKWKNNLDRFFNFITQNKIDPINFCLSFVLNNKRVNKIVVGFQSLKQLKEILKNYNKNNHYKKNFIKSFANKDYDLILPIKWKIQK